MAQHAIHRSCRRPLAPPPAPAPPTPHAPGRSPVAAALGAWSALAFSVGSWVLVLAVVVAPDVRAGVVALWPAALLVAVIVAARGGGPAHRIRPHRRLR